MKPDVDLRTCYFRLAELEVVFNRIYKKREDAIKRTFFKFTNSVIEPALENRGLMKSLINKMEFTKYVRFYIT